MYCLCKQTWFDIDRRGEVDLDNGKNGRENGELRKDGKWNENQRSLEQWIICESFCILYIL